MAAIKWQRTCIAVELKVRPRMTLRRNSSIIMDETANNLRRLFQVVNKQSKHEALESGLTGPQLWALKALSEETAHSVTVSMLADQMYVNTSTVVRILDVLEEKSFVQRVRSLHDRRLVHVSLTPNGRSIINRAPDVGQNMLMKGLKMLSENKLNNIANGLSQLVNILDSEDFPRQHIPVPKY